MTQHLNELRSRAQRLARHEAGHYVAARVFNFHVTGVRLSLQPGVAHLGQVSLTISRPLSNTKDVICYLADRIQSLFAGGIAEHVEEHITRHGELKTVFEGSAQSDVTKIKELAIILRNLYTGEGVSFSDPEFDLKVEEFKVPTTALVKQEQAVITGVADCLAARITTIGKEIQVTPEELQQLDIVQKRFPT